ncbi:hypothetical protein [Solitalea lacus]|nr:hypothetical protein [Solitalea lacus]
MKKLIFSLFNIGTFSLGACNNGTNQSHKGHDMSKITNECSAAAN